MTTFFRPTTGAPRMARRPILVALLAAGVLAGCGTDDAADPLVPSGPTGRIRFVNLITDTLRGRVNARLEGVPFGVNILYTGTTPSSLPAPNTGVYAPILTGERRLELRRTIDTNVVVLNTTVTIVENADYTVYATGGTGNSAIGTFVTRDTNTVPTATQVRVRVVHLSPTAGNVDIFVTAVGADLTTATPTLANVPFQRSAYLTVAPGTYQVRVVPAGTAPAARPGAVAINVPSLVLPGGGARTIVAADNNVGGAPLRAFVLVDR
jgi:hypothetical protein